MKHLWSYCLCALGLLAAIYLVWENGEIIEDVVSRTETDEYVYVLKYKVIRYEQKKTKTDKKPYKTSAN
jgi:hypothetical protein